MMRRIRSYRFITRLLACSLVLASVLPALSHACAMADEHDGAVMKRCCCEKMQMADHHGMPHHQEMPCEDAEPHHAPAPDAHDDCCTASLSPSMEEALAGKKATLLVQLVALVPPRVAGHSKVAFLPFSPFRDTGPPAYVPPALHLLHAQFLT